jgi:hypothetical protein
MGKKSDMYAKFGRIREKNEERMAEWKRRDEVKLLKRLKESDRPVKHEGR